MPTRRLVQAFTEIEIYIRREAFIKKKKRKVEHARWLSHRSKTYKMDDRSEHVSKSVLGLTLSDC